MVKLLALVASLALGCVTFHPKYPNASTRSPVPVPPVDLSVPFAPIVSVRGPSVEDSFILSTYDFLRGSDYDSFQVDFAGSDSLPARAHLLLPRGVGPYPGVMVFPIRGGSHLVSEALAKSLTNRGYATLRLERRRVFESRDPAGDFSVPAARLRSMLNDARRLLTWFEQHPKVDEDKIAAAGASLGGIMAATLIGMEPGRIKAALLIMAGGGIPEIVYDTHDTGSLGSFRDNSVTQCRKVALAKMRPYVADIDPLSYAGNVDRERVVLISATFDRIISPSSTKALWNAMGQPRWMKVPTGHVTVFPFFWWAVGHGHKLFEKVL